MQDALKHASKLLADARWENGSVVGVAKGVTIIASVEDSGDPEATLGKVFVIEARVDPKGLRVQGFVGSAKNRLFTGDADFDAGYALRGAPGDVVVALFDEKSRRELTRLRTPITCDTDGIRLVKGTEKIGVDVVRTMIELAAHLGERVPQAFSEANKAFASRVPGDDAFAGLEARRRVEMESFYSFEKKGGRTPASSLVVVTMVVGVILALLIGAIMILRRQ